MTYYYCYNDKCPIRTEKEPWPRSDYRNGWLKVTSKNNKIYRKRTLICIHCNEQMTIIYNTDEMGGFYGK